MIPRHIWVESQEILANLRIPEDQYNGERIFTYEIDENRCQQLKSTIHPVHHGCLIRLQCTAKKGHSGRAHFYKAPMSFVTPKREVEENEQESLQEHRT